VHDDGTDGLVCANGVNGLTGDLLVPPMRPAEVAALAAGEQHDADTDRWLSQVSAKLTTPTFGLPFTIHPENVAEAGWGIVFASDEADAVRDALGPLIEHRRRQIGDETVKVLDHQPGETWSGWLARHDVGAGNIDPKKIPYYLLIVGDPARIPFSLQYLLDVEYAVGRLHLDDADAYGRYADGVVAHETAKAPHDPAAAFFGTRHPFERATQLSADLLVKPLSDAFAPGGTFADAIPAHTVHTSIGASSTKEALGELFAGTGPTGRPDLLFSATHGMGGWPSGHPDQSAKHGALLCQDWPGVGRIAPAQYFAASDLPADADVRGLVAFFFACYGAGTPETDPYVHEPGAPPPAIAPAPFVAALPKALLSHQRGAALAVVGHVERAWGYSFLSTSNQALITPFENAVGRILMGQPIGFAMKDFNEKYATLSAMVSGLLERIGFKLPVPDDDLAQAWMERNDAQNYVLLGDPAIALNDG
jgi:hypothetical protein